VLWTIESDSYMESLVDNAVIRAQHVQILSEINQCSLLEAEHCLMTENLQNTAALIDTIVGVINTKCVPAKMVLDLHGRYSHRDFASFFDVYDPGALLESEQYLEAYRIAEEAYSHFVEELDRVVGASS
jgi:hypothetical protein